MENKKEIIQEKERIIKTIEKDKNLYEIDKISLIYKLKEEINQLKKEG